MKILLIEDNAADARLIREMLRESPDAPWQIEHLTCLVPALEKLRDETFDLVLLDLGLPDSQGMETLVRASQANGSLPMLVLTGFDDEQFALEAVRAGAQDYLVKGRFNPDMLQRIIRYAIERKHIQTELASHRDHLEELVRDRTAQLESLNAQLRATNDELNRFNRAMVGRELRMIELKKEVNELCAQAKQPPRYEVN